MNSQDRNFKEHEKIFETLKMLSIDMAVIKNALIGNGKEGYLKKTDRHERCWQMVAGGAALISFAVATIRIIN